MALGSLRLQTLVYSATVGRFATVFQVAFAIAASLGLLLLYHSIHFKGLDSEESMEMAHLARQIHEGQGFTTLRIRPLGVGIFQQRGVDPRLTTQRQPEIEHAPLYPWMLALVFKAVRPPTDIATGRTFTVFKPETWAALFSEGWLLLAIPLFFLAVRRIADPRVALVTLTLLVFCNSFWRAAIAATPFTFLLFIFCTIVYAVVRFHELSESWWSVFWIAVAALAVGIGFLAKYRFGLLLAPLVTHVLIFGGRRRILHAVLVLAIVAAVAAPWVLRNQRLTGLPLGLATYAPVEFTDVFPEKNLERQVNPKFADFGYKQIQRKWLANSRNFLETGIKSLGSNYLIFFMITGLFLGFKSPILRRLRWFMLICLGWMILLVPFIWNPESGSVTQAAAHSGDLYALLIPLIFFYGAIFFFILYDRLDLSSRLVMILTASAFILVNSLSLIYALLPPRPPLYRFPPYYPPMIQTVSKWMGPGELMMSDMPWAVAWYGNVPCMDLSKTVPQYLEINDYLHKISAIYFTPITMSRSFNDIVGGEMSTWAPILFRQVPENFPLRAPVPNLGREFLFITDRVRWAPGGG
ncbi:MAG: glycosyltransferase family 39 protein [Verrucomicrobiae bacterium]|nr:glycosyltransferase family 39 protein [Verrucomicrobiae bacterium]